MIPLALVGQVPFRKLMGLSLVSLGGLALVAVPWMFTLMALYGSPSVTGIGNNLMWRLTRNDVVLIGSRDNIQPSKTIRRQPPSATRWARQPGKSCRTT